jgi:hypothetical protein
MKNVTIDNAALARLVANNGSFDPDDRNVLINFLVLRGVGKTEQTLEELLKKMISENPSAPLLRILTENNIAKITADHDELHEAIRELGGIDHLGDLCVSLEKKVMPMILDVLCSTSEAVLESAPQLKRKKDLIYDEVITITDSVRDKVVDFMVDHFMGTRWEIESLIRDGFAGIDNMTDSELLEVMDDYDPDGDCYDEAELHGREFLEAFYWLAHSLVNVQEGGQDSQRDSHKRAAQQNLLQSLVEIVADDRRRFLDALRYL